MADDPTDPAAEPEADLDVDDAGGDAAPTDPVPPAVAEADDEAAETAPAAKGGATAPAPAKASTGAKASGADPTVVRKKVVSKRVTPKGGAQGVKAGGAKVSSTAARASSPSADDEELGYSKRYTPPATKYAPGPSPWWVPALMFGLLIVGALVIMLNYMGVFGDAANIRLVIGLAFILGGIITATQYR